MFHIVLYQPEIPPNTGNIIRLCANTGTFLHLIEPLGFEFDDKRLKRAGLDYHEFAEVKHHASLTQFVTDVEPKRVFGFSTHATKSAFDVAYQLGDAFVFGPETRGLPTDIKESMGAEHLLRLPMQPSNRSLNLANTVGIVVYEAWRQNAFIGASS